MMIPGFITQSWKCFDIKLPHNFQKSTISFAQNFEFSFKGNLSLKNSAGINKEYKKKIGQQVKTSLNNCPDRVFTFPKWFFIPKKKIDQKKKLCCEGGKLSEIIAVDVVKTYHSH